MIAWAVLKPMLASFLRTYWKPLAITFAVLAVFAWHKVQVNRAWHAGRAALVEEQRVEAEKRNDAANAADRDARKCAGDPDCLRQDDGFRRN